ncbi:uncharacterized protein LOC8279825 [Ricinus communis]|uniref:Uncharacterized protein n=1 Tax=Ricinus communis TaxID=3988 RepID=B9S3B6_RICCO|nr:uncharacterized protein LOC8279825 [Ricinus communis]EEF41898.1 conserved hypothetical protein [Ricinus communis]|eukprot:XP_002520485.1 uncharacterized protein LOC8279825 [Ricinus communis]
MEFKKEGSSSSSSFTADLFGTKESPPSSSTGIFASIFPPPSKVLGRKSSGSEVIGSWQRQSSENQGWNTKRGAPAMSSEAASYNMPNKDRNSTLMEERGEPCHLSSSLYYGGQDNYSQPPSSRNSGSYPIFKKDGVDDDPNGNNSNGASRGNWWQGSLYY